MDADKIFRYFNLKRNVMLLFYLTIQTEISRPGQIKEAVGTLLHNGRAPLPDDPALARGV
jgi:hypothetical protein